MSTRTTHKNAGFTLIELSIVLVIIGLLTAGILVGKDLIAAAEQRKAISQLEKYKTAVHTFITKYNCLPGDCDSAVSFGLGVAGGAGDNGNGNGHLGAEAFTPNSEVQEDYQFWVHLANANLVARPPADYDPIMGIKPPKAVMPVFPLNNSQIVPCYMCYFHTPADEVEASHYFAVANIGSDNGGVFQKNSLSGAILYAIDAKIDDSIADTGEIRATYEADIAFNMNSGEATLGNCIDDNGNGLPPYGYYPTNTDIECSMAVRARF